MMSPRAREEWQKWVRRYESAREPEVPEPAALLAGVMQDTVGAVAWDSRGHMAAGVSRFVFMLGCPNVDPSHVPCSGGLLLKYSGRIGEVSGDHFWAHRE